MKQIQFLMPACIMAWAFAACENRLSSEAETINERYGNLTLSVMQLEQTPFSTITRSDPTDVCTRLNFAVYDMSGERQKQVNQEIDDSDFGTATFQLNEGQYELVVVAHSSGGNPTMTDPAKIQFTNSQGYTDTFLYDDVVNITEEPRTINLTLHRIVSLCRFIINDAIPEGVAKLQFQYTGGSGHFNARTGLGVTKSIQKVAYSVQAGKKHTQYDLYTFLHGAEGELKITVTAYDSSGNTLYERLFEGVPMQRQKITYMSGDFFTGQGAATMQTFTITIDDNWQGEIEVTY